MGFNPYKETKTSVAADIGWLRLTIAWLERDPIENAELNPFLADELEASRKRFIERLKDQERFKIGLLERTPH